MKCDYCKKKLNAKFISACDSCKNNLCYECWDDVDCLFCFYKNKCKKCHKDTVYDLISHKCYECNLCVKCNIKLQNFEDSLICENCYPHCSICKQPLRFNTLEEDDNFYCIKCKCDKCHSDLFKSMKNTKMYCINCHHNDNY